MTNGLKAANSLLDIIGRTPVLRMIPFEKEGVRLYAKLEGFNPTGSIKDRTALAMIEAAERKGALKPGMTVVEASSGNTGIGLAMVCNLKGYSLIIVMSKKASQERIAMLKAYSAHLVLTSKEGGADEARHTADQIAQSDPKRYCRISQHRSWDNVEMHYNSTAKELIEQVPEPIDHFICGIGTGGTIMGVGRRLRESNPRVKIIGIHPAEAFSCQEGLRNLDHSILPEIFDRGFPDQIIQIPDKEAVATTRKIVGSLGLFCGVSSGSVLCGALKLMQKGVKGVIAVIFPDRGEKYLSTPLYLCDKTKEPKEAISVEREPSIVSA